MRPGGHPEVAGADDKAVKKDRDALQGTWVAVSFESGGERRSEDEVKKITAVVRGDDWAVRFDTEVIKGTHALDPAKKPKQFDGTITEGAAKGETILGIYELDGDTWKECWADPGRERPTEFKADQAAGHNLVVWKRQKK